MPSKKKSREKIDGVVAAVMSLDLAIRQEDKRRGNAGITVYDPSTDTIIRNGKVVEEPNRESKADFAVFAISDGGSGKSCIHANCSSKETSSISTK
jgi:phage terminase large subunit-like protein